MATLPTLMALALALGASCCGAASTHTSAPSTTPTTTTTTTTTPTTTSTIASTRAACNSIVCQRDFNPVCARSPTTNERRSFANECDVRLFNCTFKRDFEMVDKTKPCEEDETEHAASAAAAAVVATTAETSSPKSTSKD
ncbi:uncharacterized protein LOC113202230 [Frankliniella occidentalis]|uniref:Uncharacterized protein LOC113202230 n=1 Tax=Frankliniella occidentalis TaxID=133901 RepID=A0A6J1RYY0_FRAOC|nr:uncharacterized protein LOC113202230 [Frankliniella occidentalis]